MDALPLPLSDPVVTRVDSCVRCNSSMGPLRVYRGQGSPDRADRKGSIVQTVSFMIIDFIFAEAFPVLQQCMLLHRIPHSGLSSC
jgi:hypothetical protein